MATSDGGNPKKARRGSNGKFRPDPETAENDRRVVDMWGRGYTQEAIRQELGWANCSTVSRAIDRAYAAVVAPSVDAARKRSLERLDHAHRAARGILDREHVLVSHGKVIRDDETGQPLLDDGPRLAAIDRIVSIEKRFAAVLGYEAPKKTSVEVVSKDSLTSEMEDMVRELEERERAQAESVAGEPVEA